MCMINMNLHQVLREFEVKEVLPMVRHGSADLRMLQALQMVWFHSWESQQDDGAIGIEEKRLTNVFEDCTLLSNFWNILSPFWPAACVLLSFFRV